MKRRRRKRLIWRPKSIIGTVSESHHQIKLFECIRQVNMYIPELQLLHAILNDEGKANRRRLDGERGRLNGMPDVHLPLSRKGYKSLYMELKLPHRIKEPYGGLSPAQARIKRLLEKEGNCVAIAYGFRHAITILEWYLGFKINCTIERTAA